MEFDIYIKRRKAVDSLYKVFYYGYDHEPVKEFLEKDCGFKSDQIKSVIQELRSTISPQYLVFKFKGKKLEILGKSEFLEKYKYFSGFDKSDRSSFSYWFSHWCAFQLCALNLRRWKFKYLFHDFEKPWMKLFCSYKFIQKWHRYHNKHHLEYGLKNGWNKVDWEALIIDWECSRFTKREAQLDAYETMKFELEGKWKDYKAFISPYFYSKLWELGL